MPSGSKIKSPLVLAKLSWQRLALKNCFGVQSMLRSNTFTVTIASLLMMSFKRIVTRNINLRIFSGVATHHQNACSEHAIQTIIYMARTFRLYNSLHLSDYSVSDLVLWPFAIRNDVSSSNI